MWIIRTSDIGHGFMTEISRVVIGSVRMQKRSFKHRATMTALAQAWRPNHRACVGGRPRGSARYAGALPTATGHARGVRCLAPAFKGSRTLV